MARKSSGDLNALLVFVAIVEAGGITSAAERLGLTKARVSIELRQLEIALGTSLFVRTTRRVVPTEAGRRLYERCKPALAGLEEVMAEIGGEAGALTGSLKVAASVDHAEQILAAVVAEFAALHPDLKIKLCASDRIVDMVAEGIDVAFRMGWLRDSSMRAVKLGEFEQRVVASPAYLEIHGTPQHPRELAQHAWIALSLLPSPLTWRFVSASGGEEVVRLTARLQTDSPAALRALVTSAAGLSVLNTHGMAEALAAGRLQYLFPDWSLPRGGIYAVYPPGGQPPAKVRAFVDFYRTKLVTAGSR